MATRPASQKPVANRTTKKSSGGASFARRKNAKSSHIVGKCFVMMPFADPFEIYYERLYKPAIMEAGLEPTRTLDLFRPSAIVFDIWNMIQEANVLLAELTTRNANVFYELGLAHAIGKPVVLVSETMSDVPFDLQQLRIILYDKNDPAWGDKLGSDITSALTETLSNPIEAVPNIFRKVVASQAPEQDEIHLRLNSLEQRQRAINREMRNMGNLRRTRSTFKSELMKVSSSMEFDKWVRQWYRNGIPVHDLEDAVRNSMEIPAEEADRIPEIIEHLELS